MLRRQFVGQCGDRSGSADQGTCAVAGVMTLRVKRLAFGREESFEHRVSRRMRSGWAKRAVHRVSAIGGESFVAEHRPLTAAWEHITEKNSSQALPRRPLDIAYRCFLPDLAGFASLRRVGPGPQHYFL